MKRIVFVMLCMILLLSACGNNDSKDKSNDTKSDNASTKTFKQDDGTKVKIPKNPKRIVVLHPTYIGTLVKFGGSVAKLKNKCLISILK